MIETKKEFTIYREVKTGESWHFEVEHKGKVTLRRGNNNNPKALRTIKKSQFDKGFEGIA